MERRARERASDHRVMRFSASAEDARAQRLALDRGFELVRRFVHMERSLRELPRASAPEGVAIEVYVRGRDDRALFDAKEAAFAGHFGYEPDDFDRWLRRLQGLETFTPDGVFIAWQGDRAVGLLDSFRAGDVGWIAELGVRPEARGRGIGSALLVRGFERLASLGLEHARLNVDAQNETGAVRLYERHGMTVRREWRVYEKPLG
jgi:mycothiol synthase